MRVNYVDRQGDLIEPYDVAGDTVENAFATVILMMQNISLNNETLKLTEKKIKRAIQPYTDSLRLSVHSVLKEGDVIKLEIPKSVSNFDFELFNKRQKRIDKCDRFEGLICNCTLEEFEHAEIFYFGEVGDECLISIGELTEAMNTKPNPMSDWLRDLVKDAESEGVEQILFVGGH